MRKTLIVPEKEKKERLDKFLQDKLKEVSRTKIRCLIKKGEVKVNKEIKKPNYRIKPNDKIEISFKKEKVNLLSFEFDIKIIYEDEDIIVVDKPQGLIVHPHKKNFHQSLINALIYMRKGLSSINPLRCGVVHRLDKETSGVMVLAKNNFSHLDLVNQFKERKVKKEYYAICWGNLSGKITVDLPLARDKKNPFRMRISFLKAKNAYTEIEVIKKLGNSTLLVIYPHTGRMHQIRTHLQFIGYPVVGDKKYGIKDGYKELFLHAYKLGFYHPRTGKFL
ncbi:MAG TPA: RluA family pseudouridine synthase, partial [Candidatus Omnitrophica bacterium]|nr:RluA family pseudouridine synthase [Candidatus Omnitrophota bacterium]